MFDSPKFLANMDFLPLASEYIELGAFAKKVTFDILEKLLCCFHNRKIKKKSTQHESVKQNCIYSDY